MKSTNVILRDMRNERTDHKVLIELVIGGPCTAWRVSMTIDMSRIGVSRSLQRLKRKGLVSVKGTCWTAKPDDRSTK